MKKGINAWSVEDGLDFEQTFKKMKEVGFDGIELNIDIDNSSNHSLTMNTTEDELKEIKAISDKYNLPVSSISTSLYDNKLGSDIPANIEYAKALLKKQIECAKILGADTVLCVPGGIDDTQSIAAAYEASFNTLNSMKEYIKSQKIYVGLENVWNTFFISPFDMARFVDRLDCEYIKAYYDVGNVVAFTRSEYFIEILDKRIKKVHIKDFKLNSIFNLGGEWAGLTRGSLNWEKVIPALRNAGYDDYLTAEMFREDHQTFDEFYADVVERQNYIINL